MIEKLSKFDLFGEYFEKFNDDGRDVVCDDASLDKGDRSKAA